MSPSSVIASLLDRSKRKTPVVQRDDGRERGTAWFHPRSGVQTPLELPGNVGRRGKLLARTRFHRPARGGCHASIEPSPALQPMGRRLWSPDRRDMSRSLPVFGCADLVGSTGLEPVTSTMST